MSFYKKRRKNLSQIDNQYHQKFKHFDMLNQYLQSNETQKTILSKHYFLSCTVYFIILQND